MEFIADLVIAVLTIVGASSTIAAEKLLQTTPPFTLLFARFSIAALLLLACFAKTIISSLRSSIKGGIAIGSGFGLGCIFLYFGLPHVHSGHAMFLVSLEFVLVPLASFLFFRIIPSLREWFAFILAFVGFWIFTNPQDGFFSIYDLVILVSALCYTTYVISLSKFSDKKHYLGQIFVSYCFIAGISLVCMLLLKQPLLVSWSKTEYLVFTYFVFIATLARFLCQSWAQRFASPTRTALIFLMEPIFALILSHYFYGEIFLEQKILGGAIILCASLVAVFPFKRAELPAT